MKIFWLALGICCMTFCQVRSQDIHLISNALLDGPEAMTYDQQMALYIVGNANNGKILTIDSLENISVLKDSLGSNMIMSFEILGDSLFVSTNNPQAFYCLDKNTGDLIYKINLDTISIGFAQMAMDSMTNYIYIAHQSGKIFKVNPYSQTCSLFANSGISSTSQTLEVDEGNQRLMVLFWSSTSIKYVDLNDSTNITTSPSTGLGSYTGSIETNDAYIYASSWNGNQIRKISIANPAISDVFCNVSLSKPVGLCYNPDLNEFAVCNYGSNTVAIIENATPTDMPSQINRYKDLELQLSCHNNELFVFSEQLICQDLSYEIYNINGQLVKKNKTFFYNGRQSINVESLGKGIYIIEFRGEERGVKALKFVR